MSENGEGTQGNLIDVVHLKKYFPIRAGLLKRVVGQVRAVDDISFYIKKGETLGLVGESGCGKTTVGRAILMLTTPTEGYVFHNAPREVVEKVTRLLSLCRTDIEALQTPEKLLELVQAIKDLATTPACIFEKHQEESICEKADNIRKEILACKTESERFRIENRLENRILKGKSRPPATISRAEKSAREKVEELKDLAENAIRSVAKRYCINHMKKHRVRRMRSQMQFVFQDPFSSLNPRMLIKDIVSEPLRAQLRLGGEIVTRLNIPKGESKGEFIRKRTIELLEKVGLNVEHMYRFPHEFSGGQRQRIGIARALSVNPEFIVLDEPTSALDVSVQAQVLNMLNDLQDEFGLTYLFISHDLSTIRYMCDRVAVMYLGKIVEFAPKNELFSRPTHPYTEALLSVIPVPDPDLKRDRIILAGDVPSPANPPPGCRFHTRCPVAIQKCREEEPPLTDRGNEHFVACHVR